jgi:hypothetical protein
LWIMATSTPEWAIFFRDDMLDARLAAAKA